MTLGSDMSLLSGSPHPFVRKIYHLITIIVTLDFQVEEGSTCAIWGIGAVGLAVIMGCKERGASRIIAIDVNDGKQKIAEEFGATEFFNPKSTERKTPEVKNQNIEHFFYLILSYWTPDLSEGSYKITPVS